jgi:hypothetical protein
LWLDAKILLLTIATLFTAFRPVRGEPLHADQFGYGSARSSATVSSHASRHQG